MEVIAGCGAIIKDSVVCPYFCKPDEWEKEHGNNGPCQIDLQSDTNACLYALVSAEFLIEE